MTATATTECTPRVQETPRQFRSVPLVFEAPPATGATPSQGAGVVGDFVLATCLAPLCFLLALLIAPFFALAETVSWIWRAFGNGAKVQAHQPA